MDTDESLKNIKIEGNQESWKEYFKQFLEDKSIMKKEAKNCGVEVEVNLESGEVAMVATAEVTEAMVATAEVAEAGGGARPPGLVVFARRLARRAGVTRVPGIIYKEKEVRGHGRAGVATEEQEVPEVAKEVLDRVFETGALVFARVRGHPPWPARITGTPARNW